MHGLMVSNSAEQMENRLADVDLITCVGNSSPIYEVEDNSFKKEETPAPKVSTSAENMESDHKPIEATTSDRTSALKSTTSAGFMDNKDVDLALIAYEKTLETEFSTRVYNTDNENPDQITCEGISAPIYATEDQSFNDEADKVSEAAIENIRPVTIKIDIEDENESHQETTQAIVTVELAVPEIKDNEENADVIDQDRDVQKTQGSTPPFKRKKRVMRYGKKKKKCVENERQKNTDSVAPARTRNCISKNKKETKNIVTPVKMKRRVMRNKRKTQAIVKTVKRKKLVSDLKKTQTSGSGAENVSNEEKRDNSESKGENSKSQRSNKNVFRCDICGRIYDDRKKYNRHRGNDDKAYTCDICTKVFCSKAYLAHHCSTVHSDDWKARKKINPETWRCADGSYKCDICQKVWKDERLFVKHRGPKDSYPCDSCDKVCCNQGGLASHKHERHSAQSLNCKECGQVFTSRSVLDKHFEEKHDPKQFKCQLCPKAYRWENNLKVHMREHSEGGPSFVCQECGKSFTRNDSLKLHLLKGRAEGEVVFSCPYCPHTYDRKCNLTKHMKIHTDDIHDSRICPFCGKSFDRRLLAVHEKTHTKEYSYKCKDCGKGFVDSGNLKRHMSVHTGIKPYSCDVCQKRFTQIDTMKAHMKIHTGERPYACLICDHRFIQKSNLKGHMRNKHGTSKLESALCELPNKSKLKS